MRSSVFDSAVAGASPCRPAGVERFAKMDQAAQKRAGRDDDRRGRRSRGRPRDRRRPPGRPLDREIGGLAFDDPQAAAAARSGPASPRGRACGRPAPAVRARPAPCGGSGRGTGCRPGPPPAPSGRQAHRSRAPDGPCRARRWPGCRTSRRPSRSGASRESCRRRIGRRRRGFAAGVTASDDDHVCLHDLATMFHVKHLPAMFLRADGRCFT